MIRLLALVAVVVALIAAFVSASTAGNVVVLGKKHLLRYGIGWGTARPPVLFNGGDPGGKAWNLRWTGWGSAVATANGLAWVSRPAGNYYAKPGRIELRAYRLGHCTTGCPLAYTRLVGRDAVRPGGPLGHWFAWGGWRSVCQGP